MRRPAIILLITQALLTALALAFWWAVRPALLADLQQIRSTLPWATRIALSQAWLPGACLLGSALVAVAFLYLPRGSRRVRWLSVALVVTGFAFMFGVLAGAAPLFG